ncbi:hypothetical protein HVPorG_04989 [Roseomonas mucosa]|nr:hypothetical protein HVPorG_04989 [Roseomonas mucosa]
MSGTRVFARVRAGLERRGCDAPALPVRRISRAGRYGPAKTSDSTRR